MLLFPHRVHVSMKQHFVNIMIALLLLTWENQALDDVAETGTVSNLDFLQLQNQRFLEHVLSHITYSIHIWYV